jgi:hypothetical protein
MMPRLALAETVPGQIRSWFITYQSVLDRREINDYNLIELAHLIQSYAGSNSTEPDHYVAVLEERT